MTQIVTFNELRISSEKDRRARVIDLKHQKLLLLGPNGTGKSRITKNIFWALGCEPRKQLLEPVKLYEDKRRTAAVREYYAGQLRYLSDKLHIPGDERVDETKIGARPYSGGSSGPRAVLAVHLAMLASNQKHGDTTRFPFVVDTLQQSGQDEENLKRMIIAIKEHAGKGHPVILAVERAKLRRVCRRCEGPYRNAALCQQTGDNRSGCDPWYPDVATTFHTIRFTAK